MKPTLEYEMALWDKGIYFVGGMDEVGYGAIASVVVAAVVVVNENFKYIDGINDSKKLSEAKRFELNDIIKRECTVYGIGCVSNETIDIVGIRTALALAAEYAYYACVPNINYILVDGKFTYPNIPIEQTAIIKGDRKCVSIAAASIIAKCYRDGLVRRTCHAEFPEYGMDTNVGYCTMHHRDMLRKYGPCRFHRKSYNLLGDKDGGNK